jgi:hypothetical protein
MPVLKDISFCTNCGTQLEFGYATPPFKALGVEKHCKDCGNLLNSYFDCACGHKDESFANSVKKSLNRGLKKGLAESMSKLIKFAVAVVIVLMIVLVPAMVGDLAIPLFEGRPDTQNAYVRILDEHFDNPGLSNDDSWLVQFNSASNALYTLNKRIFYVNLYNLTFNNTVFYAHYAEATFTQMMVLEEIQEAVNNSDFSEINGLAAIFNSTVDEQIEARFVTHDRTYHMVC